MKLFAVLPNVPSQTFRGLSTPSWLSSGNDPNTSVIVVLAGLIPFETAGRQLDVENARFDERPTTMKKTDHFSVECERE